MIAFCRYCGGENRGGGGRMGTTDHCGEVVAPGPAASGGEEKIFVSVRLRPLNEKEIARNDVSDWECVNDNTIVFKNNNLPVPERSMYPTVYTFDRVFGCSCSTKLVYEEGAKEVALSVINGINSTVFAYGQTSSGKTYTMTGITEYTLADIYAHTDKHNDREYHLKFSAMEIYNESVRDLLSPDSTPLRLLDDPERGTVVEKLTEEPLMDWSHAMELLSFCEAERQIGETSLNEASSRSHQIIRLTIESYPREFSSKDSSSTLAASVNFVDLAGSERASQSLSAGTRLKEGCHINRSLLTLGTVIRKLSKGRNGHIPFRDSKLTRILQSSLGGNARTAIICTMSPARSHVEQSRNTLLFASCAKEVMTNAQINVIMSDKELVKHLKRELARLENELRSPESTFVASHYTSLLREKDLRIEQLEKEVEDLTLQRDVARAEVQDLLRLIGEDGDSMRLGGLINYPHLRVRASPDYKPMIKTSSLLSLDNGVRTFERSPYSSPHSSTSSDDHNDQLPYFEENFCQGNTSPVGNTSPELVVHKSINGDAVHNWGEVEEHTYGSEDLCKDVRCIEIEVVSPQSTNQHSETIMFSADENTGISETLTGNGDTPSQEFRTPELKDNTEKQSPWSLARSSSTCLSLTRSRSCKASLGTSPWTSLFDRVEINEKTPSITSKKSFSGRPEVTEKPAVNQGELPELDYGADVERLSGKGSRSFDGSVAVIELEAQEYKNSTNESVIKTLEYVMGMVDKTELQQEKEVAESPVSYFDTETFQVEETQLKSYESLKSVKDVGLDPMEEDSDWPSEFKRLQREIIRLWNACNVSLVHRTHFFLLFKGDPSDSVYMEVELRRLSFLNDKFSQESQKVGEGRSPILASCMKAVRRERDMLTRQMEKKLLAEEREWLYLKWGIEINSKNRRCQLASRLWTNTEDMEHIADSAFIVAKLVGIDQLGHAPKEMFELNFTPQPWRRKMCSLKRGVTHLL
ncbi:Plus-end-directed kinesin ATPase [Bertholletia excelsa]